jgi:AraC-like DNA-binding protein
MKALANQLGYSHVNHFITAFKRQFGYSPGTIRRRRQAVTK